MYPHTLFSLFPPFPRENKVFVAMSFDSRFDKRWADVIIPGVRSVKVNGTALEPYRVDVSRVSDCILTEILTAISNCRLFFADLTTIGQVDGRPVRNGNVMYEIGLAHAVRLPEEVILCRSDNDPLLFDMANVRVNKYDPDDAPDVARQQVSDALITALREIDLQKHLAVRRAADSLDFASFNILATEALPRRGVVSHPIVRTMGEALSNAAKVNAISRLLELGILSTRYTDLASEGFTQMKDSPAEGITEYRITPFGGAVVKELVARVGLASPDLWEPVWDTAKGQE